jgi:hypothetical protein
MDKQDYVSIFTELAFSLQVMISYIFFVSYDRTNIKLQPGTLIFVKK